MSREYAIESSKLPLSIRGTLSQPAVRGVYLEELPDRVSDTSEISSDRYSVIEDDLMNVDGISDTSCPFTHSYAAYIYILESGTYRFYVRSNFGAEATIYDGERGVSTGVTCGAQAESSSVEEITFARRGYYKVEVKYYSTGEASPVLELHFGKKSSDSASREELPQLRDLYIANTGDGYATLDANGAVKKVLLFVFVILIGGLIMLSWVGCRVASPNPDAVHIELAMTPPQSYPFIKQADHLSKHEKHFWSRVQTDSLTDQQIEAYLKDGYEWDYDVNASFYLYFRSKESPGWSLAKPYSLSYELNGTYLIPDKLESCQSSGYYGESQTVLFPTKDTAVQLLILIVPKDASLPRKQFIWDCSREQFGKIEKNKGFRILFLNYAFFYPLLTVPLPPWDSLINVSEANLKLPEIQNDPLR